MDIEGNPLVHVAEIGIHPQLDLPRDLAFLLPKLGGERAEDPVVDLVVHIVEVDLLHSTEFGVALVSVPLLAVGLLLPNALEASMRPVGAAWLSFGVAAMATFKRVLRTSVVFALRQNRFNL